MMTNVVRIVFIANPFHLVSPSPWPILTCISLLAVTCLGTTFLPYYTRFFFNIGYILGINYTSPPKPHAFVSLPLQSKNFYLFYCEILAFSSFLMKKFKKAMLKLYSTPKLNNNKTRFYNLKSKFTIKNIFCTFVSLALVFICKYFLTNSLHLDLSSFKDYIFLGIVAGGIRALLLDLLSLVMPTVYAIDDSIEKPLPNSETNVNLSKEKLIDEAVRLFNTPVFNQFTEKSTVSLLDKLKKDNEILSSALTKNEKALEETFKKGYSEINLKDVSAVRESINTNIDVIKDGIATNNKFFSALEGVNTSDTQEFSKRYRHLQDQGHAAQSEQYKLDCNLAQRKIYSKFDENELKTRIQHMLNEINQINEKKPKL